MSSGEHRLNYCLHESGELELSAIRSTLKKIESSKRAHEYIRRLMIQGLMIKDIFSKLDKTVDEIECALKDTQSKAFDFKLRLNLESGNYGPSPEENIWRCAKNISKRDDRSFYLRELFLWGFWLESLSSKNVNALHQYFGNFKDDDVVSVHKQPIVEVAESVKPQTNKITKQKLGGLMS